MKTHQQLLSAKKESMSVKKVYARPLPRTLLFAVAIDLPVGAEPDDVEEYILNAVTCMSGSKDINDPLFNIDKESIVVKRFVRNKNNRNV